MKMTQVFKVYWPDNGGGIASVMESIADGFRDWEQEIIVCQDSREKKCADDCYHGIAVRRCRQLFEAVSTPVSLQFLQDVKKRTRNSDLVVYHFPYPMVDIAVLLGMYSGRLAVWWHCGFEKYKKLAILYRPLVRNTLKKADVIFVSSRGNLENTDILRKYYKKCRVVPFCISDTYLKRGQVHAEKFYMHKQLGQIDGIGRNQITILFIGRLVWYKGCDILLKAFARIRRAGCKLVLVGSGPLEQELKHLAVSLKLKNIVFAGRVSEKEKMHWIEQCDFLVLPSVSEAEAFAVVQLEAMAFGKPVINTALKSGVPHVSVDGVTGVTVKPGSVRELAQAMEKLAGNAKLRREYGANALRVVQKEYTKEMMVKRYRQIFQKMILVSD